MEKTKNTEMPSRFVDVTDRELTQFWEKIYKVCEWLLQSCSLFQQVSLVAKIFTFIFLKAGTVHTYAYNFCFLFYFAWL